MSTFTRTARHDVDAAGIRGGWTVTVNPFGDTFFHRGPATVMVRFTKGGGVSFLAYNGRGPVASPLHAYVGTGRRNAAVEILQHVCPRFDADGDFCEVCDRYQAS